MAVKYRTPVILLSDGYLANGSEPWRIPEVETLPDLTQDVKFATADDWRDDEGKIDFRRYQRDPATMARPWAVPGTAGLEHRIGGIEKADLTGTISYDPDNHDRMVRLRQAKIDGIANDIPAAGGRRPGRRRAGARARLGLDVRRDRGRRAAGSGCAGRSVAQAHLRHLNPFPANLGDVLSRYEKVLVPEINLGQLALLLRGRYLVDVISYNRVRGLPFGAAELAECDQGCDRQCLTPRCR